MNLNDEVYDIIIVGGGAVGAYSALDATLRGYRVLLIEKNDFASGASSKSSKLVHGGVRYLEKAIKEFDKSQYNLVNEGLKERAIFLRNISNFSKRLNINIPTYSYLSLVKTYIGLYIYRFISGKKNLGKNHFLNKVVSSLFFKNLKKDDLKGCVSFYDGSFLDFKVVILLLQTAKQKGAIVKNYSEVKSFIYDENQKIKGVNYIDKIKNESFQALAKVVINATGANVDNIRLIDDKNSQEILSISSGVHIVVSKDFLGTNDALLIPNTSDKRVVFILPYLNHCLIGTTDNKTVFEENLKANESEIEYLLNEVNRYFEKSIKKEDILSSWSGIRPLIKSDIEETQAINREHAIFTSNSNLVSIAGGKWTTSRKMAEDLVDYLVKNSMLEKKESCQTQNLKLNGNHQTKELLKNLCSFYPISKETKESLITLYGDNAIKILTMADENKSFDLLDDNLPYLKAEIEYSIKEEFVKKPIDFLSRRIGLCFVNKELSLKLLYSVCEEMARFFSWSEKEKNKEIDNCRDFISTYF